MTTFPMTCTRGHFAELLGVSKQRIATMIKEGTIHVDESNAIIVSESVQAILGMRSSDLLAEKRRWEVENMKQKNRDVREEQFEEIRGKVLREIGRRLSKVRAVLGRASRKDPDVWAEIVAALDAAEGKPT